MAKARFQALVQLHATREGEARRALGRLEVARGRVADQIAEAMLVRDRAAAEADPRLRSVYAAFRVRIDEALARLNQELRAHEVEIEKARQALIAAHRDHLIFAKLRARALAEHADRRERRAERAIDDVAAARIFADHRAEDTA